MVVVTYYSDIGSIGGADRYEHLLRLMPPRRREKMDRFVFPKDRFLSMGVELLLRKALEDLGEDYEGIVMEKGPFGKPYIRGSDIRFNLSHSERRVMCSVSEQDVGCDTEEVRPIDLDIAKRYFHGTEYEAISEEQDMVRRNLLFYRYWTLKESFMKVTGLGFSIPLDSFEIVLGDGITVEQSVDEVVEREAPGADSLVFDMSEVSYISSAGMRSVLNADELMEDKDGIKLVKVNKDVRSVLDMTSFSNFLTIE